MIRIKHLRQRFILDFTKNVILQFFHLPAFLARAIIVKNVSLLSVNLTAMYVKTLAKIARPVCEAEDDYTMTCQQCNKKFISKNCFDRHLNKNVCENNKICKTCNSYYNKRKKNGKVLPHICNTYYCKICYSYQKKEHLCYVQRLVPRNKFKHINIENNVESESDSGDSDLENQDESIKCEEILSADPLNFNHIYFDFETANVDGYFILNIAVEHKVCERCECTTLSTEGPIILVLDDLLEQVSKSVSCQNMVTKIAHHCEISLFILSQNMFQKGGVYTCLSLNTHYFILMKTKRDHQQILYIGHQIFPFKQNLLYSAYLQATDSVTYGYLRVDLHPASNPILALTTAFLEEYPIVYLEKNEPTDVKHLVI